MAHQKTKKHPSWVLFLFSAVLYVLTKNPFIFSQGEKINKRCEQKAKKRTGMAQRMGSESPMTHQKNPKAFAFGFFIQADKGGLVWHHALACMESTPLALYGILRSRHFRRLDSIQCSALIPCARFASDSIHAFGVIRSVGEQKSSRFYDGVLLAVKEASISVQEAID